MTSHTLGRASHTLPVILTALLLAGCGGIGEIDGTLAVEPHGHTELVVEGGGRTTLELDGRGGPEVELRVGAGEPQPFGLGSSFRTTSSETLTVRFDNAGETATTIHYHVTSPGSARVHTTQR